MSNFSVNLMRLGCCKWSLNEKKSGHSDFSHLLVHEMRLLQVCCPADFEFIFTVYIYEYSEWCLSAAS